MSDDLIPRPRQETFDGDVVEYPMPTRAEVRAIAERHMAEFRVVAQQGGNVHQRGIDTTDEVAAYAAHLAPDDRIRLLNMYAKELNALAQFANDQTAQILATTPRNQVSDSSFVGSAIGFVVVLVILGYCYTM